MEQVRDFKMIAKNYIFKGWFIIDFITVFPFKYFIKGGEALRMLRIFRFLKLIDIDRFSKMVKVLFASSSRENKLRKQWRCLLGFKVFRLLLIIVFILFVVKVSIEYKT